MQALTVVTCEIKNWIYFKVIFHFTCDHGIKQNEKLRGYRDKEVAQVASTALNTRPVVVSTPFTCLSIECLFALQTAVLRVTALGDPMITFSSLRPVWCNCKHNYCYWLALLDSVILSPIDLSIYVCLWIVTTVKHLMLGVVYLKIAYDYTAAVRNIRGSFDK